MKERSKNKTLVLGLVALLVFSSAAVYIYLEELGNNLQTEITVQKDDSSKEILNPTTVKVKKLIEQVDETMMLEYLKKLTSFGPHPTAHRMLYKLSNRPIIGRFFDLPIEKVAKYIYNEFESMGLEVDYHYWEQKPTIENLRKPKYSFGWFVGNNVVATLPGTDKNSDEIYVVIAHYDTWPHVTGANDDSSGVAAVLTAAKLMSQCSFDHTVRFIATDGEEQGLIGSRAYVAEAIKNNDNIAGTICIDMIGNYGPGYRDDEVLVAAKGQSTWISNLMANINQRYPEFLNFTIFSDDPDNHGSDHKGFLENDYNAVFVGEAVDDYEWHRVSDTIEKMNVAYMAQVTKLIVATLAELAWDVDYE